MRICVEHQRHDHYVDGLHTSVKSISMTHEIRLK